jgi:DNA repair exonuclease SbcCD nuclease subunit
MHSGEPPLPPVVVAHSSDLHVCMDWRSSRDGIGALEVVLRTAAANEASILLLAGDVFDHNRLPLSILDQAARALADYGKPVVILPGNHDPITPNSVYRRGGVSDPPNVHVLGVTHGDRVDFEELELTIWGRPHTDYGNMAPLDNAPLRRYRRQVAMAHGHWHQGADDEHRSWLIRDGEIAALDADYLALGHWDRPAQAGDGAVPAYYSGSPHLAGTINLVRLSDAAVEVKRAPLVGDL